MNEMCDERVTLCEENQTRAKTTQAENENSAVQSRAGDTWQKGQWSELTS